MADGGNNPSYYQTSKLSSKVQVQEHVFTLYAFQAFQQYGSNERTIVAPVAGLPNRFGSTNVIDWAVRDGPNAGATLVARLQGQMASVGRTTSRWHTSADLVFQDQRFKGSVLCVQGTSSSPSNPGGVGYWAVVGGTGEFAYAQGLIRRRILSVNRGISTICELDIRVQCLTTSPDQEGDDDRNNPDNPNDDGDRNNLDDPNDNGDQNNQDDPNEDDDRNNQDDPNGDGDNPDDPNDDGDRNNPEDPNDDGDRNNPDDPNDDGDRNNPDDPNDDGDQNNQDDPNDDGDRNNPNDPNGDGDNPDNPNNDGDRNNRDDPNDDGNRNNPDDPNNDDDRNNPDDS